jgi:predicted nucleic acid-binding protein
VGLNVLDTGVVIALLDANDVHHPAAKQALADARAADASFVLPASAYAELLVAPHDKGQEAVTKADGFVDALPATVEPATRQIAAQAASLRARHGARLRLPDALVVATAIVLHAERILTTDTGWPNLPMTVEVVGSMRPRQSPARRQTPPE